MPGIERICSLMTSSRCASSRAVSSTSRSYAPEQIDDVVDLVAGRELGRELAHVAVGADADHRLAVEADAQRVGDRDDLHDARVEQPLHALAHRGLGEPDGLGDRGVRAPAVVLELADDLHRDVVEERVRIANIVV